MQVLGENYPPTHAAWGNFLYLVQQAVAAGQATQLSQHPVTRTL
jgi:hypothetical protein